MTLLQSMCKISTTRIDMTIVSLFSHFFSCSHGHQAALHIR